MTTNSNNLSRRDALMGIALCGATAATPIVGASVAKAMQTDRSAWSAAVARYRALTGQIVRVGNGLNAAHDAGQAACPRQGEFCSRYNMGFGWGHDRNFKAAQTSLIMERGKGRTLTADEAKRATADALRLVDEFDAYQSEHGAAFAEYDRQQERFDSLADEHGKAFNAVVQLPAPDSEALLYKIAIVAQRLGEWESEDADYLNAIQTDARRFLTHGRA